jgi:rhodanese-related sulfurtransferase
MVATIASRADVPRITAQELKAKLDAGQAVVFDARPQSAYAKKHIAGAISLPQSEVAARVAELPTDKLAAFYCT